MYYTPEHFRAEEIFPESVIFAHRTLNLDISNQIWRLMDGRILWTLDQVRKRFRTIIVNDYSIEENNVFSGTTYAFTDITNTQKTVLARRLSDGQVIAYGYVTPQYVPPVLIFNDTFTETNGTSLSSHTPDLNIYENPYQIISGTWEIQSNKIERSGTVSNSDAFIIDVENVDVNISVSATHYGVTAIFLRYTNADNTIRCVMTTSTGLVYLVDRVGGTSNIIQQPAFSISDGTTYNHEVRLSGTSIEWYINNNLIASGTVSTSNNTTNFGCGINSATAGHDTKFDNLEIYSVN